jgi:hypothetical protein
MRNQSGCGVVHTRYVSAMLRDEMATKKRTSEPDPAPAGRLIQMNIRIPPTLIGALDAIVERRNRTRGWPKLTRSDLIRDLLERAVEAEADR